MSDASNGGISPFVAPKMECKGCGKEPHDGFCYPVLDGMLVVLVPIAVCICIPIIVVVLLGL